MGVVRTAKFIRGALLPVMLKKSAGLVAIMIVTVAVVLSSPVFAEQKDMTAIFLRPTDVGGGVDGLQHLLPRLYNSTGGNFVIHWTNGADGGDASDAPDLTDSNSDGTPDFVEDFAAYFEESYAFEVTGRGFDAPPGDVAEPNDANNRNPNGRYDIFIYNMSNYGYTNAEQYPNTTSYSYIGVDNDYVGFPPNQDPDGDVKGAMKIIAAHTFFHAIQFGYDVLEAVEVKWWMETTSTYMEDEVYPATNDVYNYLWSWFEYSDEYGLETTDGTHEYTNFIFAKRLSEDFGDGVIRAIWDEMKITDGLTAIDNVLVSNGSSLIEEFNRFTIANFFLEDMYDDGAEYRAAIAGNTTFGGVYLEYEYNEATDGIPFTIDVGNVNYSAWMNTWAADYITLDMSGATEGYRMTFDGFNNSVNYDVSVVTKTGGVITTQDFMLDANKDGTVDLPYDAAYTDVVLVIRNSGSINTTDPSWKVSIYPLFVPPENTVVYMYTNSSDVPIPDNDGWVSSTITVPLADNGTIKDMLVYVGIDHTWIEDLYVDLTSPSGTTVRLHARTGNFTNDIYTWYDNETVLDGPGTLDDFNDEESGGIWTLSASDNQAGDLGFIDTWSIELYVDRPPTITITSPQNTTYTDSSIGLNVSADEAIDTWWYSLNAGPNITFTTNTTIVGQEGSNTIVVYANDTTGNLGSSTVYFAVDTTPPPSNQTTYNISLSPGWNLISIPLVQDDWNITAVLASIDGNYTAVYAWIGGSWKWSTALFNPLTEMDLEHGYWINMTAPGTLELSGTVPASTTINISTGWNLVGYPSITTQNITAVLSSIDGNYTAVYAWIDGSWKWSTALFNPLTEMSPGYGYWINATEDGSYEVGNINQTTYNISLSPGWNLISIPLVQDDWNITAVLASIDGNYTAVYAWIGGSWKWSTALFNPLTEMDLEHGYWINMTAPGTLELSGMVPASTTINISHGWNLVGYPSITTQNITSVLSSIGGNYTAVYAWIDGSWKWSTALFNPLTEMSPGYGYWINATEDGSYEVRN